MKTFRIIIVLLLGLLVHHSSLQAAPLAATPPFSELELEAQKYKYTARCALEPGESFHKKIGDSLEEFEGFRGLAPGWPKSDLSPEEQRWLTACLLSQINYFGAHIVVSSRGPHYNLESDIDDFELQYMDLAEGSFYGNIFAPDRTLYACSADHPSVEPKSDLSQRICASGSEKGQKNACGITWMGACDEVCAYRDATGYYSACQGLDQQVYNEVVTIYLRED